MSDFLTMMMKRKMMKTIDQTRRKIWSFLKFDV